MRDNNSTKGSCAYIDERIVKVYDPTIPSSIFGKPLDIHSYHAIFVKGYFCKLTGKPCVGSHSRLFGLVNESLILRNVRRCPSRETSEDPSVHQEVA